MSAVGWNLVALDSVEATPWRNGGGVTRELLAWPGGEWKLRMSVAEVEQDGPFSHFEGVQRWFAVLRGAGVRLRVGAHEHVLLAGGEPLRFDGGERVECALLGGPTQDFNLMLRGCAGTLERVAGRLERRLPATTLIAAWASGARSAARFGTETLQLPPRTLAWRILAAEARVGVESPDALWMEVRP